MHIWVENEVTGEDGAVRFEIQDTDYISDVLIQVAELVAVGGVQYKPAQLQLEKGSTALSNRTKVSAAAIEEDETLFVKVREGCAVAPLTARGSPSADGRKSRVDQKGSGSGGWSSASQFAPPRAPAALAPPAARSRSQNASPPNRSASPAVPPRVFGKMTATMTARLVATKTARESKRTKAETEDAEAPRPRWASTAHSTIPKLEDLPRAPVNHAHADLDRSGGKSTFNQPTLSSRSKFDKAAAESADGSQTPRPSVPAVATGTASNNNSSSTFARPLSARRPVETKIESPVKKAVVKPVVKPAAAPAKPKPVAKRAPQANGTAAVNGAAPTSKQHPAPQQPPPAEAAPAPAPSAGIAGETTPSPASTTPPPAEEHAPSREEVPAPPSPEPQAQPQPERQPEPEPEPPAEPQDVPPEEEQAAVEEEQAADHETAAQEQADQHAAPEPEPVADDEQPAEEQAQKPPAPEEEVPMNWTDKFRKFYSIHNPEKVNGIEILMGRYSSEEERQDLWNMMLKKYDLTEENWDKPFEDEY
ncbi:hypothetical protein DIPPA_31882 [Diplonema papillatum]|nr:hypothetical protein DIPPA_31882 [Diplonema papillatum]